MNMVYLVPSRGRPQNIEVLIQAWADTRHNARLFVVVDDDDPKAEEYRKILLASPNWVDWDFGERLRLGGTLNEYAPSLATQYDYIGFMGDDHRPRTLHWDKKLRTVLESIGGGVAYGNDLIQRELLPTAVVMNSAIVRTLGYYVPPGLVHLFMDNYWRDLGSNMGRLAYLNEVIIEHVHPIAGKVEWDDGYREVNAGEVWQNDEKTYKNYVDAGTLNAAAVQGLMSLVGSESGSQTLQ